MTNWRLDFLQSGILGSSVDKNDPNAVEIRSYELAYRDMMTVGRFYSQNFPVSGDEACKLIASLIAEYEYVFSRDIIGDLANRLFQKDKFSNNKGGYVTSFGLAQKIINMSFKYFYVFESLIFKEKKAPDFGKCDCPLDSIILEKVKINNLVWSKLTQENYITCQDIIKKELNGMFLDQELLKLGNLAYDFVSWGH